MIAIDPVLYKIVEFWSAVASMGADFFMLFLSIIWLQSWQQDRADRQAKYLFILFAISAVLALIFMLCVAKVIVPMRML